MVKELSYATINTVIESWERLKRGNGNSLKEAGAILFQR